MKQTELKHIVRVAGQDVDGTKKVVYALAQIKGIGFNLAQIIVKVAGIDPNMRFGYLRDDEVRRIEGIIKNPTEYNIPNWVQNRPRDTEKGEGELLVGSDLILRTKSDVGLMEKIKSWKGIRHSLGLKVRGQRTRTTGRTGTAVGVQRRALLLAAKEEAKKE